MVDCFHQRASWRRSASTDLSFQSKMDENFFENRFMLWGANIEKSTFSLSKALMNKTACASELSRLGRHLA